jgi:DNA-binding NtrC family response regulator
MWIGNRTLETPLEWRVKTVASRGEALDWAQASPPGVAVISCPLPDGTAGDLIEALHRLSPDTLILVHDHAATVADTVVYLRLGAYDVAGCEDDIIAAAGAALDLAKDVCPPACKDDLCRDREAATASPEPWRKHLIGASRAMERTIQVIRLVGCRRSTVLITGETGTGKEMVARALHLASPRAHLPMVTVNCNALPETLLEAELFGHVRGAFTGAIAQRAGRFEQAHRSTLFLDEVGDLALDMQIKLLRVLQEREFQRVGSSETVRVDVRLIAATNADLAAKVRQGKFREDLYYRLNVVPISAPPLRERPEDIPLLAQHFVEKICRIEGIPELRLAPESLAALQAHSWPGNVRQLENTVEMAVAMSGGRSRLYPSDFNLPARTPQSAPAAAHGGTVLIPDTGMDFDQTIGIIERQIIEEALRKARGNKTAAAGMLGLKRTTLAAKLRSLEAVAG